MLWLCSVYVYEKSVCVVRRLCRRGNTKCNTAGRTWAPLGAAVGCLHKGEPGRLAEMEKKERERLLIEQCADMGLIDAEDMKDRKSWCRETREAIYIETEINE